jgi:hypothetical protein
MFWDLELEYLGPCVSTILYILMVWCLFMGHLCIEILDNTLKLSGHNLPWFIYLFICTSFYNTASTEAVTWHWASHDYAGLWERMVKKFVHGLRQSIFWTYGWKLTYLVCNLNTLANSITSLKLGDHITVYRESWKSDYWLFQGIIISFTWSKRMNVNWLLNSQSIAGIWMSIRCVLRFSVASRVLHCYVCTV